MYLSIYKSKDDCEPLQQHALSSITGCQVQMLAHRKQGAVLPTLVITTSPDPITDKLKKRRSSRSVGLPSTKEAAPVALWFRLPPGDSEYSLQDWARRLQPLGQSTVSDQSAMSPTTPVSPTFINPFGSRSREPADLYQRPPSGNANLRTMLQHKSSCQTSSSRDQSKIFSESPSLRSKRSDISSLASSITPGFVGYGSPLSLHMADLPSPATTIGEYAGEFIEGWTSAQGRSSALSSPIRGRDSISSQPPISAHASIDASSPPGPRETILDRAFQLRCIPGSEWEVPGEEKLSSLARFDALMREADERRKRREEEEAKSRAVDDGPKSCLDLNRRGSKAQGAGDGSGEGGASGTDPAGEHDHDRNGRCTMHPTTQRALDYITGRREMESQRERPQQERPALGYSRDTLFALNSGFSQFRPQTGYSRSRPTVTQRTYSQPHLMGVNGSPNHLAALSPVEGKAADDGSARTPTALSHRSTTEKHQSSSSSRRISFTEFTRRLSNTSSMLVVQTNAGSSSAASSRNSETDLQQHAAKSPAQAREGGPCTSPLLSAAPPCGERENLDKRCGWRGSVGVFGGAEGGFL